ncbi:SGNH/GDSL hydrolase family protein [Flavihumibacter sp. ZG627]|uniref:SGNH/GDSL hydrolase family protein n=1 Tax=Flavihumibacter sp. ZG627 TaxID=1463156 RepID=UPI00057C49D2|nr:SGNH/GDSL hydrolase family protein [Flavihumibacter sp. ZG627]KIC91814.1 lysophospholipase [Flavihumibacter sp. ZG627]
MTLVANYLALGDSYTIGEQVSIFESFPYQLVQLLRAEGECFSAPEIVAKTGWTTDELQQGINNTRLLPGYDLVTLLIGVNNQYRGRTADNYEVEFLNLLDQAIRFAGNHPGNVVVLSIPDWGVTPFAAGRNRDAISKEIDVFNRINREKSRLMKVHYADITAGTREASTDHSLLANDGLHPSVKDYARWAKIVIERYIK